MRLLAESQQPGWQQIRSVPNLLFHNLFAFYILAICGIMVLPIRFERRVDWRVALREGLRYGLPVALGVFVCSANTQVQDIPLFALAAVMVCEGMRRKAIGGGPETRVRLQSFTTAALSALLIGALLVPDLTSIGYSAYLRLPKGYAPSPVSLGSAPSLRELTLLPRRGETEDGEQSAFECSLAIVSDYQLGLSIADGAELLKPYLNSGTRIIVLDWFNPFSLALGTKPPTGDALCWHYGRGFTERVHPEVERVLSEVTTIMVPKHPVSAASLKGLRAFLGPVIESRFQRRGESRYWTFLERREGL
jgi:hypothetical protein